MGRLPQLTLTDRSIPEVRQALQRLLLNRRPSVLNDSGVPVRTGMIVGFNENLKTVPALANSVRGAFVAGNDASAEEYIEYVTDGLEGVLVEDSISPSRGDPIYLSDTQAGHVTNVPPNEGAQRIGMFLDSRTDDRAPASMHFELQVVQSIGGGIAQGPPGPTGPQGPQGPQGEPGVGENGTGVTAGGDSDDHYVGPSPGAWERKSWDGSMGGESEPKGDNPGAGVITYGSASVVGGNLIVSPKPTAGTFGLISGTGGISVSAGPNASAGVALTGNTKNASLQGAEVTITGLSGGVTISGTPGGSAVVDGVSPLTNQNRIIALENTVDIDHENRISAIETRLDDPTTGMAKMYELILDLRTRVEYLEGFHPPMP